MISKGIGFEIHRPVNMCGPNVTLFYDTVVHEYRVVITGVSGHHGNFTYTYGITVEMKMNAVPGKYNKLSIHSYILSLQSWPCPQDSPLPTNDAFWQSGQ